MGSFSKTYCSKSMKTSAVLWNSNILVAGIFKLFHVGDPYHIETSPLIFRANNRLDSL